MDRRGVAIDHSKVKMASPRAADPKKPSAIVPVYRDIRISEQRMTWDPELNARPNANQRATTRDDAHRPDFDRPCRTHMGRRSTRCCRHAPHNESQRGSPRESRSRSAVISREHWHAAHDGQYTVCQQSGMVLPSRTRKPCKAHVDESPSRRAAFPSRAERRRLVNGGRGSARMQGGCRARATSST